MEITYPVVTDEKFPHGLRCAHCSRLIEPGQPYNREPLSMDGDTPISLLTCVYCPS